MLLFATGLPEILAGREVDSIQTVVRDVRQCTAGEPDQQTRIRALEAVLDQMYALERRRLDVAAQSGVAAADGVFREGRGDLLDDRLRHLVDEMRSSLEALLRREKETLSKTA